MLRAASTSGQAVLISGATVLIALAGMFIADNRIFTSMALGTMIVVSCAIVGSVTVLAAALSKLGDRVDWGRIPYIGQKKHAAERVALLGLRARPRPACAGALHRDLRRAAARRASPTLNMHTKLPSFTDMPSDMPVVKTYKSVIAAFPGAPTPADVVVHAQNVRDPAVATTIQNLELAAVATGQMFQPMIVTISKDDTTADVQIPLAGNGDDKASLAALTTLRDVVLPRTLGKVAGVEYAVAGETAGTHDFNEQMKARMPWVIAFVLGLAFLLLLMTFRSVVIPLTAIVLNLLSVGAAYGLLVLIFQGTWAEGILQFTSNNAITSWLPMFLFVVLFGLSMDYHVFIISRIKELRDGGHGDGGGGLARDPAHSRDGDERRDHHGRRLRHLRDDGPDHDEAARRRTRARGADRRDDHPRRPPAGDDEAARRVELVHADVARVAAVADAGAEDGAAAAAPPPAGCRALAQSSRSSSPASSR